MLCNLKARNMRGIKSHGMLLCASSGAHDRVEPLTPPEGAQVGERVFFGQGGPAGQPEAETPNKVRGAAAMQGSISSAVCTRAMTFAISMEPCQDSAPQDQQVCLIYCLAWTWMTCRGLTWMQVQKRKMWEEVQPELRTNESRQAAYQGHVMMTSQGPVTAATLGNSGIS